MTDLPGRLAAALANHYRIERELGAGGMATVYLARDVRHDHPHFLTLIDAALCYVTCLRQPLPSRP